MDKIGFANADYLNTFVEQLKNRIEAGSYKNTSITKPNGKIDKDFAEGIEDSVFVRMLEKAERIGKKDE